MEPIVFTCIVGVVLITVFTFYIGKNVGKGMIATKTNELPNGLMVVIYSDLKTVLLEELSPERRRFAVIKEAFAGEPIKPKDIVRKIKNNKEGIGLKKLGYPQMIKDCIYNEEA